MHRIIKSTVCLAALSWAVAFDNSSAHGAPPGYYFGYSGPYGAYYQYVHPSRMNPWANTPVPGTRGVFYLAVPGVGTVQGVRWIGMDGQLHSNTYLQNGWGNGRYYRSYYRTTRPSQTPFPGRNGW